MKNFSTNWYLYKTLNSKDKPKQVNTTEIESEEIKHKIKKIDKAFR